MIGELGHFTSQTSAADCGTSAELADLNNASTSAITLTLPFNRLRSVHTFQGNQATKPFPGVVGVLVPPTLPPIVLLFFLSSPATVTFWVLSAWACVRTVVVDPVECMLRCWLRSHMTKDGVEIIRPFVRHRDATATVVLVRWIVFVEATVFGAHPRAVFRRPCVTGCVPMLGLCLTIPFRQQATTTLAPPNLEYIASDNTFTAAETATQPEPLWSDLADGVECRPASEGLAGEIDRRVRQSRLII